MKTLLLMAHPRRDSLTASVADIFASGLEKNGHSVERADLVAEGFDPVMREEDEPDWNDSHKRYSPEVQREMARIERNEATLMVFPVYWWSVPAMLKGWIDRVWNNGWAYGDANFPQRRAWMIGICGNSAASWLRSSCFAFSAVRNSPVPIGRFYGCPMVWMWPEFARIHRRQRTAQ